MSAAPTPTPVIHAFNTGRTYTAQGQRIAYVEISRTTDEVNTAVVEVAFFDADRQVDGVLTLWLFDFEVPSDYAVLNAYDQGGYRYNHDQAQRDALKAAALLA